MGRANISLQPTALRSVASLPRSALRLSSVPLGCLSSGVKAKAV
jgi:hypothetical protein